jgi:hypothetical protein
MNNKMLLALSIFSSVNLVNAMENTEAQLAEALEEAKLEEHANNTVKAIVESSKNSESKNIFEVLRRAAQGASSQDKKWCGHCIELSTKSFFDETLSKRQRSKIVLMELADCYFPLKQAAESAGAEEEFNAILAANEAAAMDLKSTLKKISEILEESEPQS